MKKQKNKILVEKVSIIIAQMDANSTCTCISYQPKLPDSVKKLNKKSTR